MQNTQERITAARERLGSRLTILAHHYQHDDVVRHADYLGDSLELSRKIDGLDSEFIVFCGVFFMAESAATLARPGQKIYIPDIEASCVMSEMAPAPLVETVYNRLTESGRKLIPLAYVNTSAAVKAVCGKNGGTVCTSANAPKMLKWALSQGDGVLFLPDKQLAQNTSNTLGIPEEKRHILDIRKNGQQIDLDAAAQADVVIWPGQCVIHSRFTTNAIKAVRKSMPQAKVIVHPECPPEVVELADDAGSTSKIIDFVEAAAEGDTIVIGTETNLVGRLANQYAGKKTILPLATSLCSNMGKITEDKLLCLLESIEQTEDVTVSDSIRKPAQDALERMLAASA
ncbi:quinolinate synthase NadA [Desulfovibrio inopinatus]|uniref:quinolinate synthase NadA n=1 Tax=Desulfovibrio inopinatus TaxID=102109 RepID=UPI0004283269|nr:quinolinate synthase NadA [Desulfovibrio inopinatus]